MGENKVFNMQGEAVKKESAKPEKMSYEQLENIARQLSEQNQKMRQALNEMNLTNVFKRLDYLFKVVENAAVFEPDFIESVVKEIQEQITIPKEEGEEKSE